MNKKLTHLRVYMTKDKGICGETDPTYSTPKLFYVSCPKCLDIVIAKRIKEITVLQEAINKNQCVNNLRKVNLIDYTIRS